MIVELDAQQRALLIELVQEALTDLGPEIRHTRTSTYKDDLKYERRVLVGLRDLLSDVPVAEDVAL